MKRIHKIIGAALLVMAMLLVQACSGQSASSNSNNEPSPSQSNQPQSSAEPKTEPPTDISIMIDFTLSEPPSDDNLVKKEIEKQTNTNLKFIWVSSNNYIDKQNVTLASGDIPDMIMIDDPFAPQVKQMIKQGAFWDITPFIKDYPNLSTRIPEESWKNSQIGGKNYGIPRMRPIEGGGTFPIVRKDWLDKLNLPLPQTLDDMYNVMKAFTEQDPDGNGSKDTVGFAGYTNLDNMGQFVWVENVLNGSNGKYKLQDGALIDTTFEKGTRDALIWLNNAYNDGIISPDFPTLKNSQVREMITASKAGIFGDTMNPSWLLTGQMRKSNPDADMIPLVSLTGPFGPFVQKDPGFFGMFAIPKKVSEAKVKKILALMDFGATPEGELLGSYGIKDVHYTEKDGVLVGTEQATKDSVYSFQKLFPSLDQYGRGYNTGIPKDFFDRNKGIIDERAKVSVPNPAFGLDSSTYNKVGKEFDKKIQDLKVKVIIGSEPITAWDAFVDNLKKDKEYQQILQEFNEAYKTK
ncbi:extracellular solute-binding protein [Paenibacillus sp. HB172176]|uniref:extracellular solute-binding protein n=1 Tax=Paenibacillus sp. HB172176 TaxID=2493690 RepID=UPI00143ACAE5|nr:extracellular solute-binding protein [Paenibacillus sp. HB172176]